MLSLFSYLSILISLDLLRPRITNPYYLPRIHLLNQDVEVIDLVVTSALASKCENFIYLAIFLGGFTI